MADGTAPPRFFLSSLDPGVGKTTALVHFVKALLRSEQHEGVAVLLCLSRLEEITRLVEDMGLNEADFAVSVANDVAGKDHVTARAEDISSISSDVANRQWSINFDTLNLAQIPSFLLISCPKLGDTYTLGSDGGAAVGSAEIPNCVRNLSRNLYIKQIRIIVNSARGAIEKSVDVDTGFIDAERLWQMTRENCNSKYFVDGGFRAWRDHNCAILLSSPQFAPGLQACDGVAYPIQIQIEMDVVNKSVDLCAQASFKGGTIQTGSVLADGTTHAAKTVCRVVPDIIKGQAQCTAFYQKVVLATTETAATVNSMNYPLASAERLMNAQGRVRIVQAAAGDGGKP